MFQGPRGPDGQVGEAGTEGTKVTFTPCNMYDVVLCVFYL